MAVTELVLLPAAAMRALRDGDVAAASAAARVELPALFLEDEKLWRLRLDQIAEDPDSASWLVRAVLGRPAGAVVGHAGFHGRPDAAGMVEVGYFIVPTHRRRGYARAALAELIRYAATHGARTVRASIAPDNDASLTLVRSFGFAQQGEQWDEEDGLELVFERPAGPSD